MELFGCFVVALDNFVVIVSILICLFLFLYLFLILCPCVQDDVVLEVLVVAWATNERVMVRIGAVYQSNFCQSRDRISEVPEVRRTIFSGIWTMRTRLAVCGGCPTA